MRFRGRFCYVDLFCDPDPVPDTGPHPPGVRAARRSSSASGPRRCTSAGCGTLGDADAWSFAVYSYASERYEPSVFASGDMVGRPEDAFELVAGLHLG